MNVESTCSPEDASNNAANPFLLPRNNKLQSLLRWADIMFGNGYVIPLSVFSFLKKLKAFESETESLRGGIFV